MLISLNPGQIAFLIIVPLIVIGVAGFLTYYFVNKKNISKNYKYHYYKRIYKIALDNDYYLINDFVFKIDDYHAARVDHILFGNKYIYIFNDFYYNGDIQGKETDPSIISIDRIGKKRYEENPISTNKKLLTRLSIVTGINTSLLIGVTVVNDDCKIGIQTQTKSYYIVQSKDIKRLVKAIESRPIGNINPEQLANCVKAIDKINRKRKKQNAK